MNVKLDENLGLRAKESMQAAGHDVTTVAEQSLCSADDETVISVCQKEQRCLVTLDLDFANPLAFVPSEYSGIAVLRLPKRISRRDIADAICTLVSGLERSSIAGSLWVVRKGRIRVYRPDRD